MNVELLNTGSELLLGSVLNTHLRSVAEALFPLGLRIARQLTVPDGPAIREALIESFSRADIVIVTGGLGPTTDDITREITAELLGLELVHDEEIMAAIAERFAKRCLSMGERVKRQAMRPLEATVLANAFGTAPGLYFPPLTLPPLAGLPVGARSPHLFLLPGPPRELLPMLEDSVTRLLRGIAPAAPGFIMRNWRIAGMGESQVEESIGEALLGTGVELGYCARPGEVDLRTIGTPAQVAIAEAVVEEKLSAHIFSRDGASLETAVVQSLTEQKKTLSIAESCTGGYLAHRVTNVPGASAVFIEGFVTYANEAKMRALGVDAEALRDHGAVSSQVAAAMAAGALEKAGTDYALATTGIAGPGGGTLGKPVGTVYIALAKRGEPPEVELHHFPTDRATFKDLVAQTALDLLRRALTRA